ncbi:hypothetical protein RvY_09888 [Ramazzottius varieornatus]|uniref:Uncharacterized protein n=1 Tax=Ramazzottius varieornatus TaxID=947166 RepID=A0A1D1VFD0_RAMVA|nr:hypothetical protein RvY_09888 [Ramazzottius varieornatus]
MYQKLPGNEKTSRSTTSYRGELNLTFYRKQEYGHFLAANTLFGEEWFYVEMLADFAIFESKTTGESIDPAPTCHGSISGIVICSQLIKLAGDENHEICSWQNQSDTTHSGRTSPPVG